jgi:hypothetical protein
MNDSLTPKYAVDDMVRIPESPGYGTILGTSIGAGDTRAEGVSGTGPLYLVNEGNVFADYSEAVYAESELKPWEDEFEAMVTDHAQDPDWPELQLRNFQRFSVPMSLEITAATKAEALKLAMQWRDAIGMSGDPSAGLAALDVDWHLHHPWGC